MLPIARGTLPRAIAANSKEDLSQPIANQPLSQPTLTSHFCRCRCKHAAPHFLLRGLRARQPRPRPLLRPLPLRWGGLQEGARALRLPRPAGPCGGEWAQLNLRVPPVSAAAAVLARAAQHAQHAHALARSLAECRLVSSGRPHLPAAGARRQDWAQHQPGALLRAPHQQPAGCCESAPSCLLLASSPAADRVTHHFPC